MEVVKAWNGRQGIEIAQETKPDLILLDIQLPEMDGYSVAQELRASPEFADTPIVAVTSYAMVGDKERILEAGSNGYMEKPIDPDSFVDEIEQYLTSKSSMKGEPND